MMKSEVKPGVIGSLEEKYGISFRRSGNEWLSYCPFHEDEHPSFYVNPDKDVYHCFGCGISGKASSLLKDGPKDTSTVSSCRNTGGIRQQVTMGTDDAFGGASKGDPGVWRVVIKRADDMKEEMLALLEEEDVERADKINNCGKDVEAMYCGDCGRLSYHRLHCHDSLCPRCRRDLGYGFFKRHEDKWTGVSLNFVALQMEQVNVNSVDECRQQERRGRDRIDSIIKELSIPGAFVSVQPRLSNGVSAPVFFVSYVSEKNINAEVLMSWMYFGGKYIPGLEGHFINGNEAIQRQVELMSTPFYFSTKSDFMLLKALVKGRRNFIGIGSFYRVSGGMMKGKGDKPQRKCPYCGSTNLHEVMRVGVEDLESVDGELRLKEQPSEELWAHWREAFGPWNSS